jgi:hypothetical protein
VESLMGGSPPSCGRRRRCPAHRLQGARAARAREAARKARDLTPQGRPRRGGAARRLAGCQGATPRCASSTSWRGPAGGSAKQGRDRRFRPSALRGKILSVEKARLDKTLASGRSAHHHRPRHRGGGRRPTSPSSAPPDHHHVRRRRGRQPHPHLYLTFFYRQMKELIERGLHGSPPLQDQGQEDRALPEGRPQLNAFLMEQAVRSARCTGRQQEIEGPRLIAPRPHGRC